jgi:WD40 repeat protein
MPDLPSRLSSALSDRYNIGRELGSGGMATVYVAEDLKHDRRVALKVLKPELAAVLGAERFLAEIKTTAALQHPNILPLFDSGTADGLLYYVMPYVEGETLRARLDRERQLGVDEAVKLTVEVAGALDYAHRHGVIHRDIKPENILLHDGRPMVADFGIALAVSAAAGGRMTETGLSLGTPHYMSPEQATAEKDLTSRSDIYSLASVLYEMLTGDPPHVGSSAQQIIVKIIADEARPVREARKSVPANVAAALSRALEKLPADRFESARAFAEALQDPAFTTGGAAGVGDGARAPRWRWALAGGLAVGVVLVGAVRLGWLGFLVGNGGDSHAFDDVTFTQLTFKVEPVFNARFASDGLTVVFSAAPEGSTPRLYIIRPDYPQPQALGDSATQLLSISSRDQMAVLVGARLVFHRMFVGTLATMPVNGGAPREILAGVRDADWAPSDSGLAVIMRVGGEDRLEYPVGKVLYRTTGYLSDLRFSPDGRHIAFFVHSLWADDAGGLVVTDLAGDHRTLTEGYGGLEGVVWSPDGQRILFDGQRNGGFYQTYSVTLNGHVHLALPNAGSTTVQDVSKAGTWLLTRDDVFDRLMVRAPGAREERDLSWLDMSSVPFISGDGLLMAFNDGGLDAGPYSEVMVRRTDGSPAVRLGEGLPLSLSPDKQWVLSVVLSQPARLMLYPTGPGQARQLDHGEFASYSDGQFFPGGRQLLVCGTEPGHASRCYARPVDGGTLRPLTPDGTTHGWISPDGRSVLSQAADGSYSLYPVDGSAPRPVPSLTPDDLVERWSPDGRALWVTRGRNGVPVHVYRLDLATGRRTPLVAFGTDGTLLAIHYTSLADDPNVYAYSGTVYTSRVFEVRGLR